MVSSELLSELVEVFFLSSFFPRSSFIFKDPLKTPAPSKNFGEVRQSARTGHLDIYLSRLEQPAIYKVFFLPKPGHRSSTSFTPTQYKKFCGCIWYMCVWTLHLHLTSLVKDRPTPGCQNYLLLVVRKRQSSKSKDGATPVAGLAP